MYMAFNRQGHSCQGIKSMVAGIKRIYSVVGFIASVASVGLFLPSSSAKPTTRRVQPSTSSSSTDIAFDNKFSRILL